MLTPKQLLVLLDRGVVLDPELAVPRPPTARCLFGAPDPEETMRFAEEHLRADRERFLRRFGFDILAPCVLQDEEEEDCQHAGDGDPQDRRRGPLRHFPYSRQLLITDLWRVRRRPASLQGLKASSHGASDASADGTTRPATTS